MQQFNDETTERNRRARCCSCAAFETTNPNVISHPPFQSTFNVVSCCPSFFFAFRLRTVMTGCFVRLDKDQANIIVASSSPMIDYRSRDIHTAPVNGSNHTTSTNDEHLLRPRSSKAIISPRAQRVQRNTGMLITFLLFDAK